MMMSGEHQPGRSRQGQVVHPRLPARRGGSRAARWWGKAWVRAVEEAAYAEADLVAARALSRSGRIGGVIVGPGTFAAAVEDESGLWTVSGSIPQLDDGARDALVETVAAEAGRVAALLAGELPHALVEHAEEAGVELLPYGGELAADCSCESWVDPCRHALAVLYQLTWLVEADPFVLLHLRGLSREDLLARLHERAQPLPSMDPAPEDSASRVTWPADDQEEADLDLGLDAALHALRLLAEVGEPTQKS